MISVVDHHLMNARKNHIEICIHQICKPFGHAWQEYCNGAVCPSGSAQTAPDAVPCQIEFMVQIHEAFSIIIWIVDQFFPIKNSGRRNKIRV